MPWTVEDVDKHMKGLSSAEKGTWVEVANKALAACTKAGHVDCDASAIKQASVVAGKIREAVQAAEDSFLEAAMQMVDGVPFPASDFAYVPDPKKSSTWKLRLTAKPGGVPDAGIVGAAIAAIGKGFRGKKAQIPAADMPAVKAKIRAAWKKANPGKKPEEMAAVIREALGVAGISFSEAAIESIEGVLDVLGVQLRETTGESAGGGHEASGDTSHGTEEFKEEGVLLEVGNG